MKIKPKSNYSIDGYGKLNKNKTYKAVIATNQPDYQKEGKIFVEPNEDLQIELLLKRNEYEIVNY
jgi:hypothetical protein|tara:strand:+ start:2618 stop:2812 length:195 start_codon:yes stop_codon:yes gene_type:complete